MLGIDLDNDSAYISQTLIDYCQQRGDPSSPAHAPTAPTIRPSSSRRTAPLSERFAGHERFAGFIAGQTLARLFALVDLYTNFFQPSFKLITKQRYGARTLKRYDRPLTPCQRLIDHPAVAIKVKEGMRAFRSRLDPLLLLSEIRTAQSALATLGSPEESSKVQKDDLSQFLSQALSPLARGRCKSDPPSQTKAPQVAADLP